MANTTKKKGGMGKLGLVAGIAALGAYFLYGSSSGAARRAKIKGWVLKAKGEVLERVEDMAELNQDMYHAIVDDVLRRYKAAKNVEAPELKRVAKELKGRWKSVKKHFAAGAKRGARK